MANNLWAVRRRTSHRASEAGQAMLFLVLILGLFLLGSLCLAFDFSNMWFHRQAAQTAADAACTAGAMDLLVSAQGGATGHQGFVAGTAFNCTAGSTIPMCKYAAKNGYDSANTTPGNLVEVTFPTTVTGVTPPPSSIAGNFAFIRVVVTDRVQTFFLGLLNGSRSVNVRTAATCGLVLAKAPIPILVLHPTLTTSLSQSGTPDIKILGGPTKSVQVNSQATTAVGLGGSSQVNLTKGGPNFDGSDFGVYGGPATAPSQFVTAGAGGWRSPAAPVSDPYAQLAKPAIPAGPAALTSPVCSTAKIQAGQCLVAYHDPVHGCPDPGGCTLYTAGYYPGGITVKNTTGIFDPGLYYVVDGFALQANSMVRPGTATGDGSQGTVFYLTGTAAKCSGQTGLVCVGSNSGKAGLDPFTTANVTCAGGPAPDVRLNLPATLSGNVLLAPCTGPYGDPAGKYRGVLFFQDRASDQGGGWGGGGGFLLAGSMYFHMCNAAGTGVSCSATVCTSINKCAAGSSFGSNFGLQGNSGSTSYILGEIIADTLQMGGTPSINMALNPNSALSTLKASLLQ